MQAPGFDQGCVVFPIVDLVSPTFVAVDDGSDGGLDKLASVQSHGDKVADVILRSGG